MRIRNLMLLKSQKGFTLIELLVVMIILGLLSALVGPKIIGNVDKSKVKAAHTQVSLLSNAVEQFRLDVGRFPTTAEGLVSLVENPGIEGWDGPYLKKKAVPKDPWKKDYVYRFPGSHTDYDIMSYGADGQDGGDGYNKDIKSWE